MIFAITDLETTGGHPGGNGITEISILLHDGIKVIDRFESLINPGKSIPFNITELTGITNEMVEDAPRFGDIAEDIFDFLEETIFVAHNVNFDYSFLKESFQREGISWNARKLCTVRLSRKIFPELPSYSLSNICRSLKIANPSPHRAWGDTEATAELFRMLMEADVEGHITQTLKRGEVENFLPPGLNKTEYQKLPEAPGVYYFHDKKGNLLYIGKAKNIKQRIRSHFSGTYKNSERQTLNKELASISYELTGTELIALLLEDQEIRKHWPPLNRAQKQRSQSFGVFEYVDGRGRIRLGVQKCSVSSRPIRKFDSFHGAREWMMEFCLSNMIPLEACGIEGPDIFADEDWNDALGQALLQYKEEQSDFIIPGKGRSIDEQSFVLVIGGEPKGYGFVPGGNVVLKKEDLEEYMQPLSVSDLGKGIMRSWLDKGGGIML